MSRIRYMNPLDGEGGNVVDVQHPLPTDGDSIYAKDIWVDESDSTGWSGSITDPFDNLHNELINSSSDNPKELLIHFQRTVYATAIGFGSNAGGDFSNLEIEFIGSGGIVRYTFDESADSTKRTSYLAEIPLEGDTSTLAFNAMRLKFHTADPISITNITIRKEMTVSSIIRAAKADGSVVVVGASDSGNLKVTSAEDGLAIAEGGVTGKTFVHKFGDAPDFDQADGPVTVWDGADNAGIAQLVYQYSATADIDSLVSTDAGDAVDIEVQGLDSSYNIVTQTVTLNGQTRVPLSTALIRVFRMKNVGSTDLVGDVSCYVNSSTTLGVVDDPTKVRALIHNGDNQTLMAVYTIPAGKTGYMRSFFVGSSGASKTTNYRIKIKARPFGQVFQTKHKSAISDNATSHLSHKYDEPEVFTEKTDIEMTAEMLASGATAGAVSGGFDIVLVDN